MSGVHFKDAIFYLQMLQSKFEALHDTMLLRDEDIDDGK